MERDIRAHIANLFALQTAAIVSNIEKGLADDEIKDQATQNAEQITQRFNAELQAFVEIGMIETAMNVDGQQRVVRVTQEQLALMNARNEIGALNNALAKEREKSQALEGKIALLTADMVADAEEADARAEA